MILIAPHKKPYHSHATSDGTLYTADEAGRFDVSLATHIAEFLAWGAIEPPKKPTKRSQS